MIIIITFQKNLERTLKQQITWKDKTTIRYGDVSNRQIYIKLKTEIKMKHKTNK
jgi:hypothetical protein